MTPTENIAYPADVVAFWFAPDVQPLWFASTPDFDEQLRARFLATYRAAARHHHTLIQRFGRFPHRNAILGRTSTAEELAYLASPEAFHD